MDNQPLEVKIDSKGARADLAALAKSLDQATASVGKMQSGFTTGMAGVSQSLNTSMKSMEKFAQVAGVISKIKLSGDPATHVRQFAQAMNTLSRAKAIDAAQITSIKTLSTTLRELKVPNQAQRLTQFLNAVGAAKAPSAVLDRPHQRPAQGALEVPGQRRDPQRPLPPELLLHDREPEGSVGGLDRPPGADVQGAPGRQVDPRCAEDRRRPRPHRRRRQPRGHRPQHHAGADALDRPDLRGGREVGGLAALAPEGKRRARRPRHARLSVGGRRPRRTVEPLPPVLSGGHAVQRLLLRLHGRPVPEGPVRLEHPASEAPEGLAVHHRLVRRRREGDGQVYLDGRQPRPVAVEDDRSLLAVHDLRQGHRHRPERLEQDFRLRRHGAASRGRELQPDRTRLLRPDADDAEG
jgi:hypothetical protein